MIRLLPDQVLEVLAGNEARSLSSPFIIAYMNSHGALRSMRYHVITMFAYMSDIIAGPVIKSTIGYFKSVMVRYSCTHKIAVAGSGLDQCVRFGLVCGLMSNISLIVSPASAWRVPQ